MRYLLLVLGAFGVIPATMITKDIDHIDFLSMANPAITPAFVIGFVWFVPISLIFVSLLTFLEKDN